MIERVYHQVIKSKKFLPSNIIVATDDERIESCVKSFGGNVMMTSDKHRSGSERLWEVLKNTNFDAAINIQGDEPLLPIEIISDIYEELNKNQYEVVTSAHFNTSLEQYLSENVVKVVFSVNSKALYFSRSPIPKLKRTDFTGFYHHTGIYGYLRNAIEKFNQLPPSPLEVKERLEQLRFIENNIDIKVLLSQYVSLGVDVPDDVLLVEKMLENQNYNV